MSIIASCGHDVTYETEYVMTYSTFDDCGGEILTTVSLCKNCFDDYKFMGEDGQLVVRSVYVFDK